jgi:hypothetical protein
MENEILQTISAEIGEKVTRGNSLSYLGIDNFSKRSKVANAINNKFNLTISESDISSVNTIGQLIDKILPLLEEQSSSGSENKSEDILYQHYHRRIHKHYERHCRQKDHYLLERLDGNAFDIEHGVEHIDKQKRGYPPEVHLRCGDVLFPPVKTA